MIRAIHVHVHRARDAKDGPNNVANAGIVHLGKTGTGSEAACGNRRAHSTFNMAGFNAAGAGEQCLRCQSIFSERMKKPFWQGRVSQAGEHDNCGCADCVDKARDRARRQIHVHVHRDAVSGPLYSSQTPTQHAMRYEEELRAIMARKRAGRPLPEDESREAEMRLRLGSLGSTRGQNI